MSDHGNFDESASHRTYTAPYTSRHPVPTVQGYEEHQGERQTKTNEPLASERRNQDESKLQSLIDATKTNLHLDGSQSRDASIKEEPYASYNHNVVDEAPNSTSAKSNEAHAEKEVYSEPMESERAEKPKELPQSAISELDPRQKRKNMKTMKRDAVGREVTDPVTHLPVTIHDFTSNELTAAPENVPPAGSNHRTSTGFSAASKSEHQIEDEETELQMEHKGLEKLFPPPNFNAARGEFARVYGVALTLTICSVTVTLFMLLIGIHYANTSYVFNINDKSISWIRALVFAAIILMTSIGIGSGLLWGIHGWLSQKIDEIWENRVWDAAKAQEQGDTNSPIPESTRWLNSLLASIWPLINPDLFTSLADTLEDVMQASLPKLVRMISVEDLGQGSESIRILGIRWLPTGAAAKDVSVDGKIGPSQRKEENDRKMPRQGEIDDGTRSPGQDQCEKAEDEIRLNGDDKETEVDQENIAKGMEAEEGDFVNIEVAFSYRASSSGKSLKFKSKNAHLYLAFYLPGGFRFPVWVELRGIVGIMRMRLQLCSDPPFFSLCTLTLLGQPKADLSCVPLVKKGLNIMDLPIISSFVQSSIDAALAEYVAPKSLTLDLKNMLVGDDFKKDTSARGVIMVKIKSARGFKEGDGSVGRLKKGSSDAYVAVGWAKYGKPVWSTRVILDDMEPVWEETAFVLVGMEEINAKERLRVQLWDSDRSSADDDLGRVEVDLKELMHQEQFNARMRDRQDGFVALDGDDAMPGTLDWSVGYFAKAIIQEEQLRLQSQEVDVDSIQQLKEKVSQNTEKKLREATEKNEGLEIDQQKAQDFKIREDDIIISLPPSNDYPTGIFSIQIHEVTGLEFEKLNKSQAQGENESDTNEAGDLPSSYCTVILNHQKVFKTRTKPKNAKPFFNAGTEHLIRDWRTTEIIVSVRDSRIHENDPLLGIVYLPLSHVFRKRSQIIENFPLVGGIGYGRIRISMVFRSIQLQAPNELLGWDYGTLEITGPVTSNDIADELRGLRLKLRTTVHHSKMYSSNLDDSTQWTGKKDRPVCLAVRKRYSSCLVIEFRKNSLGLDKTSAYAVLWLKDIPDDDETMVNLNVWGGVEGLKRAESNCIGDLGDKIGTLNVPLKFWHGLSGYHERLASKNPNMQDVFEVLDTASDNKESGMAMVGDATDSDSSSSSDPNSSGDDNEIIKGLRQKGNQLSAKITGSDNEKEDTGKRGPWDQIKDYKAHSDQLHRRHRGLMQWKGVRTADWMKTKIQHGKDHVLDNFKHHERDAGIETEV